MPDSRLARTRGQCRCPDGVCLYRSGNTPGYCREVTTRRATPIADRIQKWAEHAEKTGSATLAADLVDAANALKAPAPFIDGTNPQLAGEIDPMGVVRCPNCGVSAEHAITLRDQKARRQATIPSGDY